MRLTVCALSHVGNSRETQEDNFLIGPDSYLSDETRKRVETDKKPYQLVKHVNANQCLLAVSDGMGGHACGEVASCLTVKYLSDHYRQIMENFILGEKSIVSVISGANQTVNATAAGQKERRGMGATLCGMAGKDGVYFGFNVGDSRLYRYANGVLEQLSTDHTEGQRLVNLNLLSPEECKTFPRRKNLYKYIGYNGELVADVFRIGQCLPGTVLLFCSDGLTDVMSPEEIGAVLARKDRIDKKGHMLLNEALMRHPGRGDNITLLLIEF